MYCASLSDIGKLLAAFFGMEMNIRDLFSLSKELVQWKVLYVASRMVRTHEGLR